MIKNLGKITLATILSLGLMACDRGSETPANEGANANANSQLRVVADDLMETRAIARKARVLDANYDLSIDLTDKETGFEGSTVISFVLKGADEPLTVDFSGGKVSAISLNGQSVGVDHNGFFITLPADALKEGQNKATIHYTHNYSKDGTGLHRFKDTEDGKTYLFTMHWPYYAKRVFPNFDQPNIKAEISLTVEAPKSWKIISTAAESGVKEGEASNVWSFPATPKISTYVFSLHAGPYAVWEDVAETKDGDIPIRLFARDGLKQYVAVDQWMDATKKGLTFFGDYFDIPYPFGKYDQLIVPGLNVGAMENLAAVTFTENFIQRGGYSRLQTEGRSGTILHEMAHMWFGDLVTKDWWNGMWLNESFATYMGSLAQERAMGLTDVWHQFFLSAKHSAYSADAKVTTHPIEGPVPSTAAVFTVFDSITYGKGGSALNQLSYYVGPEKYRLGVSGYLKKHSYGNTTLKDFIAGVSEAAGEDLTPWADSWLYKSGFNTIQAEFTCAAGKITTFNIHQTAPAEHNTLRDHRLQVGLYGLIEKNTPSLVDVMEVFVSGADTVVPEAIDKSCPAVVNPNHGDWGYTKVTLDAVSLESLKGHISEIDDPLARSMFWYSLYTMASNGDMPMGAFIDQVIGDIALEDNLRVIVQVNGYLASILDTMNRLTPEMDGELARVTPELEKLTWGLANAAAPGSGQQSEWFTSYKKSLKSDEGLDRLMGLLSGAVTIPGFDINQDQRWALVTLLSSHGVSGAKDMIADELARDGSDFGQRQAIKAEASLPEITAKSKWIAEVINPNSKLDFEMHKAAMEGMFPSYQTAIQMQVLDQVVDALPEVSKAHGSFFLSRFAGQLLGPVCDPKSVSMLEAALRGADQLHPTALKFLRETHQADLRCVGIKTALQKLNPTPRR